MKKQCVLDFSAESSFRFFFSSYLLLIDWSDRPVSLGISCLNQLSKLPASTL